MKAKFVKLGPDILFVDENCVNFDDLVTAARFGLTPDSGISIVRTHGNPNTVVTSLRGLQSKANPWLIPTAFLLGFLAAVICFKVL